MRIQPTKNYVLQGPGTILDKNKVYPASIASNLPDYEQREAIFVYYDDEGSSMLLEKGEYVKTQKRCE